MKRYQELESWLKDVNRWLNNPSKADERHVMQLECGINHVDEQLVFDVDRLRQLIKTLKALRDAQGAGRGRFEERAMRRLAYLAHQACGSCAKACRTLRPLSSSPDELPEEQRPAFEVLQELCLYAMDCIAYSRPRDTLAGARRSAAFEILAGAVEIFEMPESVLTDVKQRLNASRPTTFYGAFIFCEAYYSLQPNGVPEDLRTILLKLVKKTDSRSIAVGALNVLVESGNIGELEALEHIDDWKERNY